MKLLLGMCTDWEKNSSVEKDVEVNEKLDVCFFRKG